MITGIVNAKLEATISVNVPGPGWQFRDTQAVIDTGYNGFITLPMSMVTALSLPRAPTRSDIR